MEKKKKGLPVVNSDEHVDVISSLYVNVKWSVSFPARLPFLEILVVSFLQNTVRDIKCAYMHNGRVRAGWLSSNRWDVDGYVLPIVGKLLTSMVNMSQVIESRMGSPLVLNDS